MAWQWLVMVGRLVVTNGGSGTVSVSIFSPGADEGMGGAADGAAALTLAGYVRRMSGSDGPGDSSGFVQGVCGVLGVGIRCLSIGLAQAA